MSMKHTPEHDAHLARHGIIRLTMFNIYHIDVFCGYAWAVDEQAAIDKVMGGVARDEKGEPDPAFSAAPQYVYGFAKATGSAA